MAASLMGVNATIKSFPAALSLSTNTCKALSLSPSTCKALSHPLSLSLSSSSRVEQKKSSIYCAAAGLTGSFLVDKLVEKVNEQLYWFEKEMIEVKGMIEKLREDHEMTIQKLLLNKDNAEEKGILLADLEVMFWYLSDEQAKTIRTNVKSKKPITKWPVKDFSVGVNQLLDWFEKKTMEAEEMVEKLRKEYQILIQNILDEEDLEFLLNDWEEAMVLMEDLEVMSRNLKKKYANTIIAKAKAAKLRDQVSKTAKLLYPFFVL